MPNIERRIFNHEARAENSPKGTVATGCAAPHGNPYEIAPGIRETLKRGCFDYALSRADSDIRCTYNHSRERVPLGRTTAGTLEVNANSKGLMYRCLLPSSAQDVAEALQRGDVRHSSFAFVVAPDGEEWTEGKDPGSGERYALRSISKVDQLFDVAIVDDPANIQATAELAGRLAVRSMPAELRARIRAADDDELDDDDLCECNCAECQGGNCDDCSDPDCDDPNCRCANMMSRAAADDGGDEAKTKRVDGEDLHADCFIIVQDPTDPGTWHLAWKFSAPGETENHLRDALARFDQVKGLSESEKEAAWEKLVHLCKAHGIHVDDQDDARARELQLEIAALD